jgi:hypothetical protein
MQCPACSYHNADDAKFCAQCGTNLAVICGVCGTAAERGAAFCTNCGAALPDEQGATSELARYLPQELLNKLESARAGRAMQGERRTVTMLFADIQGSTAAAEHLDPEDWAEIINGAFEHLIAPVYRYEGTLARLQGDAVLAFFGAPIAHEDDPVRALRAGLEIVEAIGRYRAEVEERWGRPSTLVSESTRGWSLWVKSARTYASSTRRSETPSMSPPGWSRPPSRARSWSPTTPAPWWGGCSSSKLWARST